MLFFIVQLALADVGNEKPVIRMFGITEGGHSVMAHIHNFLPYLYVELNDKLGELNETDLKELRIDLNKQFMKAIFPQYSNPAENPNKIKEFIHHVEVQNKASVYFYQEKMTNFIKIYCAIPTYVTKLRVLFEQEKLYFRGKAIAHPQTYESNMPFALRFMIDNDINGMQWMQIPAGKYLLRPAQQKESTC